MKISDIKSNFGPRLDVFRYYFEIIPVHQSFDWACVIFKVKIIFVLEETWISCFNVALETILLHLIYSKSRKCRIHLFFSFLNDSMKIARFKPCVKMEALSLVSCRWNYELLFEVIYSFKGSKPIFDAWYLVAVINTLLLATSSFLIIHQIK
jgi:hypothetical protein